MKWRPEEGHDGFHRLMRKKYPLLLQPTESAVNNYPSLRVEEQFPGMERNPYALKCSIQKSAIF